ALGAGVLLRVRVVHAVDLGGLEQQVGADLDRAQRGARIGGEERVAGAGGEDRDAALLQVADRAAADVVLAHVVDLDRTHHPDLGAELFQRVLHRQRVDHRGQHAHLVAGDAVHAAGRQARAAGDVAAADHDAHLGAGLLRLDDLARQAADHLGVGAVVLVPHRGLAGQLEQDAAVGEGLRHGRLRAGKRGNSSRRGGTGDPGLRGWMEYLQERREPRAFAWVADGEKRAAPAAPTWVADIPGYVAL